MAKITKHHLDFENEIDYDLIGICSHVGDYRLVWSMNELLNLNLVKSNDDFKMTNKKGVLSSQHPYYFMSHESERYELYLIKNKNEGKFLIPEKQQIDYFLFICNNLIIEIDDWVDQLRTIPSVVAAYAFDTAELSSTEQIIFE